MKEVNLFKIYISFSEIIEDIVVLEEEVGLFKAKIIFKNKTVLRIFQNSINSKYSFFWLNQKEKLITGWDNAPHHKEISSFPDHKHIGNKVFVSKEKSLIQVLKFIKKKIQNN